MNRDTFRGQWRQIQGEMKRHWGKLTDDELTEIEGNADKFVGKLQEHYGYGREQAEREFDTFLATHP
jgi:uncharacterized protein YjbJ (UPF0337 family)